VRAVVVLAVVGLVGLVIAALTGSTPLAIVVIVLALAGIVQLVRDWRREPRPAPAASGRPPSTGGLPTGERGAGDSRLAADEFSPDISTDPDGPSSDARADQP
jgi:hypothetical protein